MVQLVVWLVGQIKKFELKPEQLAEISLVYYLGLELKELVRLKHVVATAQIIIHFYCSYSSNKTDLTQVHLEVKDKIILKLEQRAVVSSEIILYFQIILAKLIKLVPNLGRFFQVTKPGWLLMVALA